MKLDTYNKDMSYCEGHGCAIREQCLRYTLGLRSLNDATRWWMYACDIDTRHAFISNEPN